MTRPRALALAATCLAVVAYATWAERLWELSDGWDVLVVGFVVLPVSLALVWLGLPLVDAPPRHPLLLPALAGAIAVALGVAGVDGPFQVGKLAAFAFVGLSLVWLFESLWWVTFIAFVIPWVDIWSVSAGPTKQVIEDRPGIIEGVAVGFPFPGRDSVIYLGPPDVIFFALFLGIAARFGLRVTWTWLAMTVLLGVTLAGVVLGTVSGLPALPAVCFGFMLPNLDLLLRDIRDAIRGDTRAAE